MEILSSEFSLQNKEIVAENASLRNEVAKLKEEANSSKAQATAEPSGRSLVLELLEAKSQIIQIMQVAKSTQASHANLQSEVKHLNLQLKDARSCQESTESTLETARREVEQCKHAVDKLLSEKAGLERRLLQEMQQYAKSAKAKENMIVALEEAIEEMELSARGIWNPATDNKNTRNDAPAQLPKLRSKEDRRLLIAMCTKYDLLKEVYEALIAEITRREAKWSGWKTGITRQMAKIYTGQTPDKRVKSGGDPKPDPCFSAPLEHSIDPKPPSTSTELLRSALMNSVTAMERESETEKLELNQRRTFPSSATLLVEMSEPSTIQEDQPGSSDESCPATSFSPMATALAASARRQRHYSPTISEEPLSQLPQARLKDLNLDDTNPVMPAALHDTPTSMTVDKNIVMAQAISSSAQPPTTVRDISQLPRTLGCATPTATEKCTHSVRLSTERLSIQVKAEHQTQPLLTAGENVTHNLARVLVARSTSSPPESHSKQQPMTPLACSATGNVLGQWEPTLLFPEAHQKASSSGAMSVSSSSRSKRKVVEGDAGGERPKKKRASDPTSAADYAQYKGRGRYAQTIPKSHDRPISALYEIDKTKNSGLDYEYDAVVRDKVKRKKMDATDCECCKDYYQAIGFLPPVSRGPRWRSPSPSKQKRPTCQHITAAQDMDSFVQGSFSMASALPIEDQDLEADQDQHRRDISRHRHDWAPAGTPPDYWQIGFPTTQQIESINRRADAHYNAKRDRIARDANSIIELVMSVYSLPATDITEIKAEDPQATFAYISPVLDHIFLAPATTDANGKTILPSLDFKVHSAVYTLIYNTTTTVMATNSKALYELLSAHLEETVKKIGKSIDEKVDNTKEPTAGEQLVSGYLAAWDRFDKNATYIDRLTAYLNRHWVKREEDEGRGAKLVLTTWGYPADGVTKELAEMCSKASSGNDVLVPTRPLALRNWRMNVVEKLKMESVDAYLKTLGAAEQEKVAEELRKSFWTAGVEPTKPQIIALEQFLPKAPEAPKPEVAEKVPEAAATAEPVAEASSSS
ncbi:hypothetical protein FRB98_005351 [Tulasnella sp. 332]|nr:hypothetical protein FRB98_005351 [Tulasnella sp. 332]